MSKLLQQENITIELIIEGGSNIFSKTHSIIADPAFFKMLRGLYEDDDCPGKIQKADEIKLRYDDLIFTSQK